MDRPHAMKACNITFLDVCRHVCEVQLVMEQFQLLKTAEGHHRYVEFRNKRAQWCGEREWGVGGGQRGERHRQRGEGEKEKERERKGEWDKEGESERDRDREHKRGKKRERERDKKRKKDWCTNKINNNDIPPPSHAHMIESCHTCMSHVTHARVMSHMHESCQTCMSHVTHARVMSRMHESCHTCMSHVTHESAWPSYEGVVCSSAYVSYLLSISICIYTWSHIYTHTQYTRIHWCFSVHQLTVAIDVH